MILLNIILSIMKKLNKLGINSKSLMKNEELMTLRGGYDEGGNCDYWCCIYENNELLWCDVACDLSAFGAMANCNFIYNRIGQTCQCW